MATSSSARPLVSYAVEYKVGEIIYGAPRCTNAKPWAADNELGVLTDVQDPERHMVLWLSGDLENPEDASTFRTLPNDMRERPCNRSDIARKMRTVQLPAAWSNDEPQALDAQAAELASMLGHCMDTERRGRRL